MAMRGFGAAVALGLAMYGPATANPLKSLYSTIELSTCRPMAGQPSPGAWLCPGLEGYPVYVAEHDARTYVSVGTAPERRRAASQTLGTSSTLFKGKSTRATLEWRIVRRDGQPIPFATIQRFYTRDARRTGEVLVVTRVTETEDCHVAYIDALANPDAIALARRVADRDARSFNCRAKPRLVGRTGQSPM